MKNRNISLIEYFELLQKEYIFAEIRKKIYPKKNDREYYQKVLDSKKTKILDISERNNIPSIFSYPDAKDRLVKKLIPAFGFPDFISKEENRQYYEISDKKHYYRVDSDFKFIYDSEIKLGKLKTFNGVICSIESEGIVFDISKNDCARIF